MSKFEYVKTPFGLAQAPAYFTRLEILYCIKNTISRKLGRTAVHPMDTPLWKVKPVEHWANKEIEALS